MTTIATRPPARAAATGRTRITLSPGNVALVLGILAFGYRVALLAAHEPPTNSDEATMGLAALHIAQGRGFPIFFYGQHYMGTIEAYLAAPLVALFGPGTLVLRVPVLLMYPVFLFAMYRLTRALYTPWFAAGTVALLALGSDRVIKDQLIAAGGYPEITLAGAVLVLISVELARDRIRRPYLALAAWGLTAGLCVWTDWLIAPYLAGGVAILALRGRRWLRGRGTVIVLGAFLVGAAPLLVYNLTAPLSQNSVSVFLRQSGGGSAPLAARLYGGVLYGIPMATGMCSPGECHPAQMWWGAAYPVLLVVAGAAALLGIRRARLARRTRCAGRTGPNARTVPRPGEPGTVGAADTDGVTRYWGRLVLVVAAGLTVAVYARSSAAARFPVESARYLDCVLVSTPAAVWPLWRLTAGGRPGLRPARWPARWPALWNAVPLAAVAATAVLATGTMVAAAPAGAAAAHRQHTLIATLYGLGARRIYSDYWTCDRIVYATGERILCAALRNNLTPGFNRYAPYWAAVAGAPEPAYVLPAGSPADERVAGLVAASGVAARVVTVAGFQIWLPATPLPTAGSRSTARFTRYRDPL